MAITVGNMFALQISPNTSLCWLFVVVLGYRRNLGSVSFMCCLSFQGDTRSRLGGLDGWTIECMCFQGTTRCSTKDTCNMLVGGLELEFYFPYIGNVIIPSDELIFFRGVGIPPIRLHDGS